MIDLPDKASIKPRPRKATGPARPSYLEGSDVDRVMAVLLALVSEVSAIRDRIDSHEKLADAGQLPATIAVEDFDPDSAVEDERTARRDAMIGRLFRVVTEEIEAVGQSTDSAATSEE